MVTELPCGATFALDADAWVHYESCRECEAKHKERGFYGEQSQGLRSKRPRKQVKKVAPSP